MADRRPRRRVDGRRGPDVGRRRWPLDALGGEPHTTIVAGPLGATPSRMAHARHHRPPPGPPPSSRCQRQPAAPRSRPQGVDPVRADTTGVRQLLPPPGTRAPGASSSAARSATTYGGLGAAQAVGSPDALPASTCSSPATSQPLSPTLLLPSAPEGPCPAPCSSTQRLRDLAADTAPRSASTSPQSPAPAPRAAWAAGCRAGCRLLPGFELRPTSSASPPAS